MLSLCKSAEICSEFLLALFAFVISIAASPTEIKTVWTTRRNSSSRCVSLCKSVHVASKSGCCEKTLAASLSAASASGRGASGMMLLISFDVRTLWAPFVKHSTSNQTRNNISKTFCHETTRNHFTATTRHIHYDCILGCLVWIQAIPNLQRLMAWIKPSPDG